MQGLIRSVISIDGRMRVAEADRFINENIGRKLVAPFRIYTSKNLPANSGYYKFCEEFTRDQRIAIFNATKDQVWVYVLPPALKDSISFLKGFHIEKGSERCLYGIIICRESAPLNAPDLSARHMEVVDLSDPPEPRATGGSGSSGTGSSSSSSSSNTSVAVSTAAVGSKTAAVPPPAPPVPPLKASVVPPPVFRPTAGPASSSSSSGGSSSHPPPAVPPLPLISSSSLTAVPLTTHPLLHPPATSATAAVTPAQVVTAAAPPRLSEDNIRKVATFCAANGVQTIEMLKRKPEAQTVMPFLFADGEGHSLFLDILKSILNR